MENELKHWGILGMKWGVRRYQNPDGTLTEAGKKRYSKLNTQLNYHLKEHEKSLATRSRARREEPKIATMIDASLTTKARDHYNRGVKIVDKMNKYGFMNSSFDDIKHEYEKTISDDWVKKFGKITMRDFETAILSD